MENVAAAARAALTAQPPAAGQHAAEPEPGAGAAAAATAPRWFRPVALALIAVAVALAGLAGAFGVQAWQGDREEARRQAAVQAARQVALNLTTISHDTAEGDVQRLLDSSTGQFRQEFDERRQSFVDVLEQAKVVTTGEVAAAGLQRLDDESARALVAVHAEVRNTAAEQAQPRDYRLGVTLRQVDGRWLASDVEFVP